MLHVTVDKNAYHLLSWLRIDPGLGERGCQGVEPRIPEREVGGSIPTFAVLCP